jgi:serine/threonine-protein kinase HipA
MPSDQYLLSRFIEETGKLNISPIVKTTRVAPFFSNLLPEGRLREFLAQQAGVKSGRELPVFRVVGDDLPGAVVVRAEADGPPLEEAEDEIRSLDESQPLRFSLAGVQMKFSAVGSPERGGYHSSRGPGWPLDSEITQRAISADPGKRILDAAACPRCRH